MEKEYTHRLLDKEGFTSPASKLPSYELKMLQQYIHGINLQKLGEQLPQHKKEIMLIKFLKHRRNQQVEVFYKIGAETHGSLGKVSAIGRDFMVLTTLIDRIWIPYAHVESAQPPYGVPEVSNAHQHVVMDDNLRRKLLTEFGKTVSSQEVLKRQFFEESLGTSLQHWKGTRVKIYALDHTLSGKIVQSESGEVTLKSGFFPFSRTCIILLKNIYCIKSVRTLQFIPDTAKMILKLSNSLLQRKRGT